MHGEDNIKFKVSVHASHKSCRLRREDGLVMFREIIAVYYDTKYINTDGNILGCLMLKQLPDIITALQKKLTELVVRLDRGHFMSKLRHVGLLRDTVQESIAQTEE
jgi:hypothetical protein